MDHREGRHAALHDHRGGGARPGPRPRPAPRPARPGHPGRPPAPPAGAGQPALDRPAPLGDRSQLRPRLPRSLRPGDRRRHPARRPRHGAAHRHGRLRPGPAALGGHPHRGDGGRPGGPGDEGPPRHHRRRRQREAGPHHVRAGARRPRRGRHAGRARRPGDEPGRPLGRRPRPRAATGPGHRPPLGVDPVGGDRAHRIGGGGRSGGCREPGGGDGCRRWPGWRRRRPLPSPPS